MSLDNNNVWSSFLRHQIIWLKKGLIKIIAILNIHRLIDIFCGLIREVKRLELEKKINGKLVFIYQGLGDIKIEGDLSKFSIGKGSHLKSNSFIECSGGVSIGDYFHPARSLTIFSTKHIWEGSETLPYSSEFSLAPVIIGNCVWVGANVTILPGTIIEEGAIIGAGSVVFGRVPKCAVVSGNPAKVIKFRDIDDYDKKCSQKSFF
jgi:acetyltransferase-like isoleucine patch superfamily enzyme